MEAYEHEFYSDESGTRAHCWFVTSIPWEEFSLGKKYEHIDTKFLTYARIHDTIEVIYCELCREWVESPMAVCEYQGRNGYITVSTEGYPDRKPVRADIHRLTEAIKALSYYAANAGDDTATAKEVLKKIRGS